MKLEKLKSVLPEKNRQAESSSCFDAEANLALYFFSLILENQEPQLRVRSFTLGNGNVELLSTIQKTSKYGARNHFVYTGEYTGFIGCSWSGELRRPLMLKPQGDRSQIRRLLTLTEETYPDRAELYDYHDWYPRLLKILIPQVISGFDLSILDENMSEYDKYLRDETI
jgi:hypothetical protein